MKLWLADHAFVNRIFQPIKSFFFFLKPEPILNIALGSEECHWLGSCFILDGFLDDLNKTVSVI